MNEILFFIHIGLVAFLTLGALRLGKEALFVNAALLGILANLFVLKQISLLGLHVTCSDVLMIGCLLNLNCIQAFYGKESAKQAVKLSFSAFAAFAILAQIHLYYRASDMDTTQTAFSLLLSPGPRLLIASLATFWIVQRVDLYLFQKMPFPLALRSTIALFLSQLLDTLLFSFLGLFGIVHALFDIIVMSYAIKAVVILATSPFLMIAKKVHRVKDAPL